MPSSPGLSRCEQEVLLLLKDGKSDAEIAASLGKSISTVKSQTHAIYCKTGARNRAEVIRRWWEGALVPS